MAGALNKVTLIGNVGRDPEIRHTQDGRKIANLSLATTETWKDRQTNERRENTEWHRVVVFSPGLADVVEKYVKKGSRLYIEGQLQTRKWSDASGVEKYTTEVVLSAFKGELIMLDGRGDRPESSAFGGGDFGSASAGPTSSGGSFGDSSSLGGMSQSSEAPSLSQELDDEVPF